MCGHRERPTGSGGVLCSPCIEASLANRTMRADPSNRSNDRFARSIDSFVRSARIGSIDRIARSIDSVRWFESLDRSNRSIDRIVRSIDSVRWCESLDRSSRSIDRIVRSIGRFVMVRASLLHAGSNPSHGCAKISNMGKRCRHHS